MAVMTGPALAESPNCGKPNRISVCLCTYRRPEMLKRALEGILSQAPGLGFELEIVVVDNDHKRSARGIVEPFQGNTTVPIIYDCEPVKNIAHARNRSIGRASGQFIATIDDDEFPAADWLGRMQGCLKDFDADGVLGPVLPDFPDGAPGWLKTSRLCDRPRYATGSLLTSGDLRTGNALFKRELFKKGNTWFDPALGLTGGSDGQFIVGQIRKGRKFVWCDEAAVFETVSAERWPARYYYRRYFRVGTMQGRHHRRSRDIRAASTGLILLLGYVVVLPLMLVWGTSHRVKVLTKIHYQLGCLLSFLNLVDVPERA